MTSANFWSLSTMNKFLAEYKFLSNEEMVNIAEGYFVNLIILNYKYGITTLQYHLTKCNSLKGDYIEKYVEKYIF